MKKNPPARRLFESEFSRRAFLKTSAAAVAGVYGLQHLQAPLAQAAGEVKWLTWAHFVTASDQELKRQAEDFSKKAGTNVGIELLAHLQLPAKKASEAHAKSGHDVLQLDTGDPELYKDLLSDVSDLAEELGKAHGGWYDFARDICVKGGKWRGIPWAYNAYPLVVRSDLMKKVGVDKIETYDDLLAVGKKLKDMGNPIGFQLSSCADSNVICNSILWAFGGKMVAEDGKTIAIDSSETAKALEYSKKLYQDAMDPEVLSWDDAGNNRFMLSGKGSIAWNPPSIYWVAKAKQLTIEDKPAPELLDHYLPPAGPAGRFASGYPWILGIWNFAANAAGAKEFLRYHFSSENYNSWLKAGDGYNMPMLKEFEKNPVWEADPKYKFAKAIGQYTRIQGWPGKPTEYSQIAGDLYVIPNMFAHAASGNKSVPDAIKWADAELKQIYAGQKKAEKK